MRTIKEDIKWCEERKLCNVYCKCGHSIQIPATVDSVICSHCKKKVQNTSIARFRYKLINERNKVNENN